MVIKNEIFICILHICIILKNNIKYRRWINLQLVKWWCCQICLMDYKIEVQDVQLNQCNEIFNEYAMSIFASTRVIDHRMIKQIFGNIKIGHAVAHKRVPVVTFVCVELYCKYLETLFVNGQFIVPFCVAHTSTGCLNVERLDYQDDKSKHASYQNRKDLNMAQNYYPYNLIVIYLNRILKRN